MKIFNKLLLISTVLAEKVLYGPVDVYVKNDPTCESMKYHGCQSWGHTKDSDSSSCAYQKRCHYAITDYWWYNKLIVVKIPAYYCEVRDKCSS